MAVEGTVSLTYAGAATAIRGARSRLPSPMTTPPAIPRGKDGVVVGRSSISWVDGQLGNLVSRGFDVRALVPGVPYESIVHLLLYGEPPGRDPSPEVLAELERRRGPSPELERLADALPPTLPPLEAMRTLISLMGDGHYGYPPTRDDGFDLIARLPLLFTRYYRRARGLPAARPDRTGSQVAIYLERLLGREPEPAKVRALEGYFDLLADHGMNASTFALCITISTESDLFSAATAALGVLKGPRHGGAPSLVIDMLDQIGTPDRAADWVRGRLARKELLYGFGHRVYKVEDPRSELLHRLAKEVGDPDRLRLAETVETAALAALRESRPGAKIYTNVEFYAAILLEATGVPPDCFTPTFALARTAGWAAHALEQVEGNRVMRPDVVYDGPPPGRAWPRPLG